MNGLSPSTTVELVLWGGVLVVLLIFATLVVWTLRRTTVGDSKTPSDMLANFRELHQQGDISDAEFRTIKSVLGPKPRREINGGNNKG